MHRTLEYGITDACENDTIKSFLKSKGYSSQNLIELKKNPNGILVNGLPSHVNYKLRPGELLTINIIEESFSEKIKPVELPLDIVYEDEDLLVINKPAGMPIHPSMNNYDNSVANAVAWYFDAQGIPFVFRCINRLDRDTSGLTIIAKHMISAGILSEMVAAKKFDSCPKPHDTSVISTSQNCHPKALGIQRYQSPFSSNLPTDNAEIKKEYRGIQREYRGIQREYLALVRGTLTPPSGTINAPIGRKPGSVIERMVDFEHGEKAVTHYQLLEEANGHSLVALRLETGRTHQIRIHMKHLGFPLIGDYLYNPDRELISRQALHSHKLTFSHPITGAVMEFTAPLPEDMKQVLSATD